MKTNTHPEYYLAEAVCACGNKFKIGSAKKELRVEICAACHPFYTGKEKTVDAAGRVDKFKKRAAKATKAKK